MDLEDLANNLSFELKEKVHVENACIILGGQGPHDYAVLQLGANDGELYLSAPILDIYEDDDQYHDQLSTLLELNGDTKNYPNGRIAYNASAGNAIWIEKIEQEFSAKQLIELIQARGQLIAQIRYAFQGAKV